MCYGCWEEMGKPLIKSEKVLAAVPLIEAVYKINVVGGNMHIVLDDWNLDEQSVEFCDRSIASGGYPTKDSPEQLAVDRACCDAFKAMSEQERASALALARGYE